MIQTGTEADQPFIATSWVETMRSVHEGSARRSSEFKGHHLDLIRHTLRRESVSVKVAKKPDDNFTVYAFAVLQPDKIHMVYTRKPWRKMGLAKMLLAGIDIRLQRFSTWSIDMQDWMFTKWRGCRYEPLWWEVSKDGGELPSWKNQ